jgi:hypothetical protein
MLAIAAYGITAKACKLVGIAGFKMYPQRPFGLRFVSQNIESYFSTVTHVLNPASPAYGHFLSHATLISLVIAVSVLVTRGILRDFRSALVLLLILLLIVCTLPNPTNILLQVWWPSPRSLSSIAMVVSCVLLSFYAASDQSIFFVRVARIGMGLVIFSQVVIYIEHLAGRAKQEEADFQAAGQMIYTARQDFPTSKQLVIRSNLDWRYNLVNEDVRSFEYGSTCFASLACRIGLFAHLSNNTVTYQDADPKDCAQSNGTFSLIRMPDYLLVCAR